MSAILPGYTYDIFVSYRQKDNKYEGWVTEFVDHLKSELEATFKEDISLYFDENPHDGLLETHNVDKSLRDKLKCLVFIPIISRTYCDPNSFAWQHEFIAFNNLAKEDPMGKEVKLANGNFASRVLPIKIHDIDAEDKNYIERVLGGIMRPVEFIYRSAGVNRPLKPEDSRIENLNHTYYRDQINKVANAIKEIIFALKNSEPEKKELKAEDEVPESSAPAKSKKLKAKYALGIFIVISLIMVGYLLIPALFKPSSKLPEKSIAVLPFENMSNDTDQEYFCEGMMQEILNQLFMIGGLKIPSGKSSMKYKGSKLSIQEMAKKLDVAYLLEGYVNKAGDNVRITVRLINGKDERLLWTENYQRTMKTTEWLEIQSDVAQKVAESMQVAISPEVSSRMEKRPTNNTEAYLLVWKSGGLPLKEATDMIEKAISLDPGYADAYAELAVRYIMEGGYSGLLERKEVLDNAEPLLNKALQLNSNSITAHYIKGILKLYYYYDFESVEKEYQIVRKLSPSNVEIYSAFSDYHLALGKYGEAYDIANRTFENDKNDAAAWAQMALVYYYNGQEDKAANTIIMADSLFPQDEHLGLNTIRLFNYMKRYDKSIAFFEKSRIINPSEALVPYHLGHMGLAYYKTGDQIKAQSYLNELLAKGRTSSNGSPSFFAAAIYTAMDNKDKAIELLKKAYADHEVEMYWLKVEPLFKTLHGDPRFEDILRKIGFKENI
jgi:TolB-like protein/Tfp pilus assembly protein PilF